MVHNYVARRNNAKFARFSSLKLIGPDWKPQDWNELANRPVNYNLKFLIIDALSFHQHRREVLQLEVKYFIVIIPMRIPVKAEKLVDTEKLLRKHPGAG